MLRDFARPRLLPAVWLALAFVLLAGCAMVLDGCALFAPAVETVEIGEEARQYKAAVKACRPPGSTCEQYVACRRKVELEHGRTYTGRCEP